MTKRQERVGVQVRRVLSELVAFELQDPRLANVTVSRVEMTGDLSRAKVYILPTGGPEEMKQVFQGLEHARGYLRHQVAERVQLRFAPEIVFALDQQGINAERVQKLLDELQE